MLAALEAHGVHITHWSGTSAGAVAAALCAVGNTGESLKAILYNLGDSDIRQPRPLWRMRLPWLRSIMDTSAVRCTLERLLPDATPGNLTVWATDMSAWQTVNLARPNVLLTRAVLASMSVPLIFPSVRINGVEYQDGGLRFNVPLPSDWRNYDETWILIASSNPRVYRGGMPLVTDAVRALNVMMYDQIGDVLEQVADDPRVHVLWPRCGTSRVLTHLDHDLIAESERLATIELRRLGRCACD